MKDPFEIKAFFKQLKNNQVERGPKVVESRNINQMKLMADEWNSILKQEKKENISHSILYTSLRLGVPLNLRPKIWAFLINAEEMRKTYVKAVLDSIRRSRCTPNMPLGSSRTSKWSE